MYTLTLKGLERLSYGNLEKDRQVFYKGTLSLRLLQNESRNQSFCNSPSYLQKIYKIKNVFVLLRSMFVLLHLNKVYKVLKF